MAQFFWSAKFSKRSSTAGPRFKLKQNSIYVYSHFTLAQNYLKVRIVLSTSTNKKFCQPYLSVPNKPRSLVASIHIQHHSRMKAQIVSPLLGCAAAHYNNDACLQFILPQTRFFSSLKGCLAFQLTNLMETSQFTLHISCQNSFSASLLHAWLPVKRDTRCCKQYPNHLGSFIILP